MLNEQELQEQWIALIDETPPENVMLMTKIDDEKGVRNEQLLCFHSRLFWTGCGSDAMYVYYTPTHWRLQ
jgi:hypothetical protein